MSVNEKATRACQLLHSLQAGLVDASESVDLALDCFNPDNGDDAVASLLELQQALSVALPEIGAAMAAIDEAEMEMVGRVAAL